MLLLPHLAKCLNRSVLPKAHPWSGAPGEWLADSLLALHGLQALSFDFFVDWSKQQPALSAPLWMKRIVHPGFPVTAVQERLPQILQESFPPDFLETYAAFADRHHLDAQLLIFDDAQDWTDDRSQLLIVGLKVSTGEGLESNPQLITLAALQDRIRAHSGGPVRMGGKGLTWSTSRLECSLAATSALYPGDVDLLLLDAGGNPAAIVELKKFTLSPDIAPQTLGTYYPYPDRRKYQRLAILRDRLGLPGQGVPLFVLYYPTHRDSTQWRLELLHGSPDALRVRAARNYPLPATEEEYPRVAEALVKAIHYAGGRD